MSDTFKAKEKGEKEKKEKKKGKKSEYEKEIQKEKPKDEILILGQTLDSSLTRQWYSYL